MTVTATPPAMARSNQKSAPTGERVMVASDVLLSVFLLADFAVLAVVPHGPNAGSFSPLNDKIQP